VKTSAGESHFASESISNYFAHTRIEDVADIQKIKTLQKRVAAGESVQYRGSPVFKEQGDTRRVIELQSDLFQKGGLGREIETGVEQGIKEYGIGGLSKRSSDIQKLEPYRNTWQERIIREEIKQAATDEKKFLQFPTGKTAMKIEGLGTADAWDILTGKNWGDNLSIDNMKVGTQIAKSSPIDTPEWIITDILEDGKFKAVPKSTIDSLQQGNVGRGIKEFDDIKGKTTKEIMSMLDESIKETFDISGKIDTSNPIFRFYEKQVQRFLKRIRSDMKRITDPQGIDWFQIKIKKEDAKKAIEAFGVLPLSMFPTVEKNNRELK